MSAFHGSIWRLLEINPTNDKKKIKQAYARKVKTCHPEDDSEGFQEIRWAYQQALARIEKHPYQDIQPKSIILEPDTIVLSKSLINDLKELEPSEHSDNFFSHHSDKRSKNKYSHQPDSMSLEDHIRQSESEITDTVDPSLSHVFEQLDIIDAKKEEAEKRIKKAKMREQQERRAQKEQQERQYEKQKKIMRFLLLYAFIVIMIGLFFSLKDNSTSQKPYQEPSIYTSDYYEVQERLDKLRDSVDFGLQESFDSELRNSNGAEFLQDDIYKLIVGILSDVSYSELSSLCERLGLTEEDYKEIKEKCELHDGSIYQYLPELLKEYRSDAPDTVEEE